jgi:hypothetical protein
VAAASRVAVTDSADATVVSAATTGANLNGTDVLISNRGAQSAFLDSATPVTSAVGFEVKAGEIFSITLYMSEAIFARCATGLTTTLGVWVEDVRG